MSYYSLVLPGDLNAVPRGAPESRRLMSLSFHRAVEDYLIEHGEPRCFLVRTDIGGSCRKELVYELRDEAVLRMVARQLELASKRKKPRVKKRW